METITSESRQLAVSKTDATHEVPRQIGVGVIKAIIGIVPFVGPALNEALFDIRSRIQQDRVTDLVQRLSIGIEALGESKIDKAYLETDEFSDIATEVLNRTARTRSESKRERFARIILGNLIGRREGAFDPVFRELVEELTDDDIDVLRRFVPAYALSQNANTSDHWRYPLVSPLDYAQPLVLDRQPMVTRMIIQNLIRMGLLFDDSHGRLSSVPYSIIMPTDLGAAFCEWLQALPEMPASALAQK